MAQTQTSAPALSGGRAAAGVAGDKIAAVEFANLDCLLAGIPSVAGNPQARTYQSAYDAGRDMVQSIAASYTCFEGTPLPPDDRFRDNQARGLSILLDRVIGGMCGNFGFALAYADAAAERLGAHAQTEERDRDGPSGFASKTERLMEASMERDAQAAWIGWLIQGATEAFEEAIGTPFKLYQPANKEKDRVRGEAEVKKVATSAAAFLANRKR